MYLIEFALILIAHFRLNVLVVEVMSYLWFDLGTTFWIRTPVLLNKPFATQLKLLHLLNRSLVAYVCRNQFTLLITFQNPLLIDPQTAKASHYSR